MHITLLSDLPVGSTSLNEARRAAGYLSKYVTKGFEDPGRARLTGAHRYEVAQGFQPTVVRLSGCSSDAVLNDAIEHMGYEPSQVWSSNEAELWQGPPAVWFAWD
ncbi:hypothetical protein GCM10009737_10530 [Nocardioides lentus]|uniref:Uncharacterized protein n=1 Tax=Nocardioides lentus TaxID=338077 RepID=A0ABN2P602_9ACTN